MRKRYLTIIGMILIAVITATVLCACNGETRQIYFDTDVESGVAVYRMYMDSLTTISPKVVTRPKNKSYSLNSSNPSIVKIDGGKLVALREGIVTLTATSDGKSATASVIVEATKPVTRKDAEKEGGYLIMFITEYGSVAGQVVAPGQTATEPDEIYRPNGYKLFGWYADEDCTQKYDFSTPVNSHVTLYALWGYAEPSYDFVTDESGTVTLLGFKHKNVPYTDVVLPTVNDNGEVVTSIASTAFADNATIKTVVIPECYVEIGESAFSDCTALETVTIGKNVKKIGESAFLSDKKLSTVTFEGDTEEVGNYCFYKCSSLTSIKLPDSVKTLGQYAFADCTSLKDVTLSASLNVIDLRTFYGCAITEIDLKNVTELYNEAFMGCTKLRTLKGYEHISFVGSYVFGSLKRSAELATAWLKDEKNHTTTEFEGLTGGKAVYLGDILVYVIPMATKSPIVYVKESVKTIAGQALTDAGRVTVYFTGAVPPTYSDNSRPFGEQATTINGTTSYRPTADIIVPRGYTEVYTRAFLHSIQDENGYYLPTVYSFAVCESIHETIPTLLHGLTIYVRKPFYEYESGIFYNKILAKTADDPYKGITYTNECYYTIFDYVGDLEKLDVKTALEADSASRGATMTIERIDSYAFATKGLKLKEIILPTEILEIGNFAFSAETLTSVAINGNTNFDPNLTRMGEYAINTNVSKNLTIFVPLSMLNAYTKSRAWSKYNSIIRGE